jgi:DNA-directed RNA polymerase subunit RPC12/RpoP
MNYQTGTKQKIKKFGAILCPACGYIQGKQLTGSVFKYKGPFTSVNCYRCKKKVIIAQNVLFDSDSAYIVSEWIMVFKNRLKRN